MTEVEREPASFRDPATRIFYVDGRVLRGLDEQGASDWERLAATTFFSERVAAGKVVGTEVAPPGTIDRLPDPSSWSTVLEHERIPVVSYPYEWTFDMLRDAAALHLELLVDALDEDMTMKDGYAFNVQWRGASPVFVDVGSFERLGAGGPWAGYRQFCGTFLFPLLLEAHLGVPFQRYLLGHLEGLDPADMRRLLGGRKRFRKGVFRNVYLHSAIEARSRKGSEAVKQELGSSGFGAEVTKASARNLLKLVRRLRSPRARSTWAGYRDTCSYSDDDRAAKDRFVAEVAARARPVLAWDLGCNDGRYARLAAEHAAYVVAVDADDVVVDRLYRELRADGPANVLPLVMDLADPSPGRGWRNAERRAFVDRGRPDLVLALALVHHLAISANVPLGQVVDWLADLGATVVVEFVHREDPMARRLLANKPSGTHEDYGIEAFEGELGRRFTIERRETLPSATRTLFVATPAA